MARLSTDEELYIPRVSWSVIRSRLKRMWVVRDAPHHSLIGQTRSGKSFLTRYGILETCQFDNVIIIDGKGDDATLEGLGRVVHRFPTRAQLMSRQFMQEKRKPRANWFRLVTHADTSIAKQQVEEALRGAMAQGDWIVVIDETRYVTDAREPCLGLRAFWEQMILRGGSRGVGVVSLTQEPRWVPGSFYTQPSFIWFSRIEDEAALKRVAEVGSSRQLLPKLAGIARRDWIYMDNLEEERFIAETRVTR